MWQKDEKYRLTKGEQPEYNRNYRHMQNDTIYSCLQKLIRVQWRECHMDQRMWCKFRSRDSGLKKNTMISSYVSTANQQYRKKRMKHTTTVTLSRNEVSLAKHQKIHTRYRNEAKKKNPPKPAKEQSKINCKCRLSSHCQNVFGVTSLLLCFKKILKYQIGCRTSQKITWSDICCM